jgi:hypothetical protein
MGRETIIPQSSDPKDGAAKEHEQPSAVPPQDAASTLLSSNKKKGNTDNVSRLQMDGSVTTSVGAPGQSTGTPGAFPVGPRGHARDHDAADADPLVNANQPSDVALVAHLAPDEADVEAKIKERLENEMNVILLEEEMRHTLIDSDNIVVVPESKDPPIGRSSNKRRTWIMVILAFLVVGAVLAGVIYQFLQDDGDKKKELTAETPVNEPSLAPSEEPPPFNFETMGPIWAELRSFIAPTDEDLEPFTDPASPQSQALAWLQDDPITLTPGRLTQTVLERYALAVLYYTTSGPSSWIDYHLNSESACTWNDKSGVYGVYCSDVCIWNNETSEDAITCSSVGGTVDFLILSRNNLVGTIPWEVVLLTNLIFIDFDINSLTGSIPTRINELTALDTFWAIKNGLTGPLPPTFSPAALIIDLSENMLTGSIPESWWTTMTALEDVRLYVNMLTGTLSTSIGLLSNMTIFAVYDNLMTGSLPTELGQLGSLTAMSLNGNSFTGSLNDTVCLLSGWSILEADCAEVDCPCCTTCCYGEKQCDRFEL